MEQKNDLSTTVTDRKSVHVYDETYKIPHEEMLEMIKEATAAPSSVNMQPWRFVVAKSEETREILCPLIRFNTRQNNTSSAMVMIFDDMQYCEYGGEVYNQTYESGKMPKEVRDQQLAAIIPYYKSFSREEVNDVVEVDSNLATMRFILVTRDHGYETNPIGGFEADQLAEAFGLDKDRYVPAIISSIGKTVGEGYESVRLAPEKITTFK